MNLKSKDSIARLKKVASKKLGVRAKRLFLASGAEISDVDELQNNDTLYVSQGEAFYKSLGTGICCFSCAANDEAGEADGRVLFPL